MAGEKSAPSEDINWSGYNAGEGLHTTEAGRKAANLLENASMMDTNLSAVMGAVNKNRPVSEVREEVDASITSHEGSLKLLREAREELEIA